MNLEHLFITNANIFLPMSNLTRAQRLMLDPETGPALLAQATPEQLAVGMGQATYTPPRGRRRPRDPSADRDLLPRRGPEGPARDDPVPGRAIAGRGLLAEGARRVGRSDDVHLGRLRHGLAAPGRELRLERVHDEEAGPNSLYFIPDANHYLQNDQPDVARRDVPARARRARRHPPGAIAQRLASPLLVDRSRSELPRAADLLKNPA